LRFAGGFVFEALTRIHIRNRNCVPMMLMSPVRARIQAVVKLFNTTQFRLGDFI
jgi:hypothetical protein